MTKYYFGWRKIQQIKRSKRRKEIIKEVLIDIAIVIGFIIVMAIAGRTNSY